MKTYTLTNGTLNATVAKLNEMAVNYYRKGAKADTTQDSCIYIGALSAVLDKLAEVMGGLWLYGEDFTQDADEIRRFVKDVQSRAECLAEVAEVEDITIIYDSVAAVIRWINRGAQMRENIETANKYGVHIHTVEVLRDIETLTEEEAREIYTAEELAKAKALAEAETATENENDREQDNTPQNTQNTATEDETAPRWENIKAKAQKAAQMAKGALCKAIGVAAVALCICIGFGAFIGCVLLSAYLEDVAGVALAGWVRFPLVLVLMFTAFLDLAAWAELNALALFDRLHLFEGIGGLYDRPEFLVHPVSMLGVMVRNLRQA